MIGIVTDSYMSTYPTAGGVVLGGHQLDKGLRVTRNRFIESVNTVQSEGRQQDSFQEEVECNEGYGIEPYDKSISFSPLNCEFFVGERLQFRVCSSDSLLSTHCIIVHSVEEDS